MPIKLIHRCKLLPNKRWKAALVLLFERGNRRVVMLGEDGDPRRTYKTEKQAKRRNLELTAVF